MQFHEVSVMLGVCSIVRITISAIPDLWKQQAQRENYTLRIGFLPQFFVVGGFCFLHPVVAEQGSKKTQQHNKSLGFTPLHPEVQAKTPTGWVSVRNRELFAAGGWQPSSHTQQKRLLGSRRFLRSTDVVILPLWSRPAEEVSTAVQN